MDFAKLFSSHAKVTVELGMGDGRLLESLAKDGSGFYLGIEVNSKSCGEAMSRIALALDNVMIISGSFEEIVPTFPEASVDRFIALLPDPAYIDDKKQDRWEPFYKTVYA
ncbi:MAG TPA: hypothetical protein VHK86_08700, partial [Nitrososphaera sp.]|nr:hypothetical protein [Nitrososphaera sp.]